MVKRSQRFRLIVQAVWAFITNCYLIGFVQGRIYQGPLKNVCVPGLNCYSCPGAIASCPIGALQAVIGSAKFQFPYYAAGFLVTVGAVFGRFVCGWLCPFGMIQDLLYRIPFVRKIRTFPGDRLLRSVKYGILAVFVILLPAYLTDLLGQGQPAFCKWICPAGTLEGGWPLVALNEGLQQAAGWLFAWKNVVLVVTIFLALIVYRPFCRYLCPLGAVYSAFNPICLYRYQYDESRCIHCGKCAAVCDMNIDPTKRANSAECIRCGKCVAVCPVGALTRTAPVPGKGSACPRPQTRQARGQRSER